MIKIEVDTAPLTKKLDSIQRTQIPFAISKALNDTAFAVRKDIVERVYPASFTVRNKSFPRVLFRVKTTRKTDLAAEVYQSLDRPYMHGQIVGTTRKPQSGRHIAIRYFINVRRGACGVPASQRTRNLNNAFIADLGKGLAIWQKRSWRGADTLKLMYSLKPSVPNRARFPFFTEGARLARAIFPETFVAALRYAMSTAKR